jgi:hypothetical protein
MIFAVFLRYQRISEAVNGMIDNVMDKRQKDEKTKT